MARKANVKIRGKEEKSNYHNWHSMCPSWLLVAVKNTIIKSNLGRKGWVSFCSLQQSSREFKARTQGRSLKPGTEEVPYLRFCPPDVSRFCAKLTQSNYHSKWVTWKMLLKVYCDNVAGYKGVSNTHKTVPKMNLL